MENTQKSVCGFHHINTVVSGASTAFGNNQENKRFYNRLNHYYGDLVVEEASD